MDKHKARRIFAYVLLVFLILLYIGDMLVFLFGSFTSGLYLMAYNVFLTVIVYFLLQWQKRMEDAAKTLSREPNSDDFVSEQDSLKEDETSEETPKQ